MRIFNIQINKLLNMKTLSINLIIATFFVFTAFSSHAQSNNNPQVTTAGNPKLVKTDYMNLELENNIKGYLISGTIPADLPKYTEGTTKEVYEETLRAWAKDNLQLIKKEYHTRLLADPKKKKAESRSH